MFAPWWRTWDGGFKWCTRGLTPLPCRSWESHAATLACLLCYETSLAGAFGVLHRRLWSYSWWAAYVGRNAMEENISSADREFQAPLLLNFILFTSCTSQKQPFVAGNPWLRIVVCISLGFSFQVVASIYTSNLLHLSALFISWAAGLVSSVLGTCSASSWLRLGPALVNSAGAAAASCSCSRVLSSPGILAPQRCCDSCGSRVAGWWWPRCCGRSERGPAVALGK